MTPIEFRTPPRRILLVKPSAIGDVVHTLPILNLLRRKWTDAHIAWLLTPPCTNLLDGHPMLNEVIPFERRRLGSVVPLMKRLRGEHFDLVVDLQGLFRSGWFTRVTGAPLRVGFANAREVAPFFYTHKVDVGTTEQHAIDRYLKVAAALGCGDAPVEFPFHVTDDDRRHVESLVPPDRRYAVLIPGTNWVTKRWGTEKFAELASRLRDLHRFTVVAVGSPDENDLAQEIGADVNTAGRTTLRQLVALLNRASLVVANDSGPMHIAAALGRPLVTPFGPTNPIRTGPYARRDTVIRLDIPCSPCYSRTCTHHSCMKWLGVEDVMREAEKQLNA